MKIEDLPPTLQEYIEDLKHGSESIESAVTSALEGADNIKDFLAQAKKNVKEIQEEAKETIETLEGYEDPLKPVTDALKGLQQNIHEAASP